MKILRSDQIRDADAYTIKNEPINSVDLMERAAAACTDWFLSKYEEQAKFKVFVGPGNNGGDGLAIARQLSDKDRRVEVSLLKVSKELSKDASINLERLKKQDKVKIIQFSEKDKMPVFENGDIVIDCIFGSGINKPIKGWIAEVIRSINSCSAEIVAIDTPSGLFGEDNSSNDLSAVIQAKYTLTFQFPSLSFFFPQHDAYVGDWLVLPIGLHEGFINKVETNYYYLSQQDIRKKIKKRKKFSHKGTYGHALLISGSYGKIGAAILASKACLRSGVGLLTAHVPRLGYEIIQTAIPEAMISIDQSDILFSESPDLEEFDAVGIGPGIGCKNNTCQGLYKLIKESKKPLVIDADGINILGKQKEWQNLLPENTILTPHPKEFERLVGKYEDDYLRNQAQIKFAKKHKVYLILKGAHTAIACPDGTCYFNTTGNPGMATAGSGDVLTGILLGLLSQGYSAKDAALMGVYIHGWAGDLALKDMGQDSLIASDIVEYLKKAFKRLQ